MKAQLLSMAAIVFYHGAYALDSDGISQIRSESLGGISNCADLDVEALLTWTQMRETEMEPSLPQRYRSGGLPSLLHKPLRSAANAHRSGTMLPQT